MLLFPRPETRVAIFTTIILLRYTPLIFSGMPMFIMSPESAIVIIGDQVTLTCSAEATPTRPNITWWDGDGVEIISDQIFNISPPFFPESGTVTVSMVTFNATAAENQTGNGSMFQCRATVQLDLINRTLANDSEVAAITIAGKIHPLHDIMLPN